MKYFIILIISAFIFLSCNNTNKLQESIIIKHKNGNAQIIELYETVDNKRVVRYYKEFYEDNTLKIEGSIKNNKRDGHWTYYYGNSNKWSEGNYINGLAQGKFTQYYENGNVWMYTYYKDDNKTKSVLFDDNGKQIE